VTRVHHARGDGCGGHGKLFAWAVDPRWAPDRTSWTGAAIIEKAAAAVNGPPWFYSHWLMSKSVRITLDVIDEGTGGAMA